MWGRCREIRAPGRRHLGVARLLEDKVVARVGEVAHRERVEDVEQQRLEPRRAAALAWSLARWRGGGGGVARVLGQRAAQPEGRGELRAARGGGCRRVDGGPRGAHRGDAVRVRARGGGGVARDDAPEGVAVEGRARAREPVEAEHGRRGRERRVDRRGVVHAQPRRKHPAIRAAERDYLGACGRAPLNLERVDQRRVVGQRLLERQPAQCRGVGAAGGAEGLCLAIVAVLGPDEERAEGLRPLPHPAGGVHVEIDRCLVAAVEEDRPARPPVLIIREDALREAAVVGVREMVQRLRVVRDGAVRGAGVCSIE